MQSGQDSDSFRMCQKNGVQIKQNLPNSLFIFPRSATLGNKSKDGFYYS